jgi:hypothetical protein
MNRRFVGAANSRRRVLAFSGFPMPARMLRLSGFMVAATFAVMLVGCKKDEGQPTPPKPATPPAAPATNSATNPASQAAGSTVPATTAASQPAAAERELFDGKTLKGWKNSGFAGGGEPEVQDGALIVASGEGLSGVTYTGEDLPRTNYELVVVAKKVDGHDFFCGITFPVDKTHATMVCGGWGGALVGISSINDNDASENGTAKDMRFDANQWYTIKIRVTPTRIQTWIDGMEMQDVETEGKKIDVRTGIEEACPLGLSTYRTTGAVKSVKIRKL